MLKLLQTLVSRQSLARVCTLLTFQSGKEPVNATQAVFGRRKIPVLEISASMLKLGMSIAGIGESLATAQQIGCLP